MNETGRPSTRLEHLRPRDVRAAASKSLAYTRFVKIFRWILPLFAVVGLAVLLVWPMVREKQLAALIVERVPDLMVENLHLTGFDSRNQSYSLTAKRALQARGAANKETVDLESPKADISLQDGVWLAGQAAYGRLDQKEKKLWLGGKVELFHDQGTHFTSDEAYIDIDKETVWGEKPVLIQGSFGEIRGNGFRLLQAGKIFIILGPATAKLDLQAMAGSDKPSAKK